MAKKIKSNRINDQIWDARYKPGVKAQSQPDSPDAHLGAEPQGTGSTLALGAARGLVWTSGRGWAEEGAVEAGNPARKTPVGVGLQKKRWIRGDPSEGRARGGRGLRTIQTLMTSTRPSGHWVPSGVIRPAACLAAPRSGGKGSRTGPEGRGTEKARLLSPSPPRRASPPPPPAACVPRSLSREGALLR